MSDLHNEFTDYKWQIPNADSDIIVLAGDIGNGLRGVTWAIEQSQRLEKPILMVFGNHEYFECDLSLIDRAREACEESAVTILENDTAYYMGYRFLGTTLWTDYLLWGDAKTAMDYANNHMRDHRLIRNINGTIFTPHDAVALHHEAMDFLNTALDSLKDNTIVITHHQPTIYGIQPEYKNSRDVLSPAFASDLERLMIRTEPVLWIAGHSHWNFRYQLGDTLIVSNQMGYLSEGLLHFNGEQIVSFKL
jgi:Icc-related predicted phosphoesterase